MPCPHEMRCKMKKVFSLVKLSWLIILFVVYCAAAFGVSIPDKAGTSGLSFLKLGIGARPTGMGEAFTSISGDIFSLYWNPARGCPAYRDRICFYA